MTDSFIRKVSSRRGVSKKRQEEIVVMARQLRYGILWEEFFLLKNNFYCLIKDNREIKSRTLLWTQLRPGQKI